MSPNRINPSLGGEVRIHAERQIQWNAVGLWLIVNGRDGERVAQPVVLEPLDVQAVPEPCVRLQMHEAQQLMDELWACGLRPAEGAGSAGAMAATQANLTDLRSHTAALTDLVGVLVKGVLQP